MIVGDVDFGPYFGEEVVFGARYFVRDGGEGAPGRELGGGENFNLEKVKPN